MANQPHTRRQFPMPGVAVATTSGTAASRQEVQLFGLRCCPDAQISWFRAARIKECLIRPKQQFLNGFDEFVPELHLEFPATGCIHELVAIMPRVDSMNCIEGSMKASRFAHLYSAGVRQSLVGAIVVVSLLSASRPVEAHGDVKGDAAMPVTSGATGPQMTVY